ncbi:hypothetical protein PF006_g18755 [Phytophthora fragariae]|uniref:Uncharacterized protein n=1 Tax=Phytophthora fragariae TaxID=53985 RepID=A0A6A3SIY3_9STRA|nr:hypothetical protein PF006_g18755 [Phytophthora fragariae]
MEELFSPAAPEPEPSMIPVEHKLTEFPESIFVEFFKSNEKSAVVGMGGSASPLRRLYLRSMSCIYGCASAS